MVNFLASKNTGESGTSSPRCQKSGKTREKYPEMAHFASKSCNFTGMPCAAPRILTGIAFTFLMELDRFDGADLPQRSYASAGTGFGRRGGCATSGARPLEEFFQEASRDHEPEPPKSQPSRFHQFHPAG
jgi:hypothetical protein